jgi:HK97 gp10 family phage protein
MAKDDLKSLLEAFKNIPEEVMKEIAPAVQKSADEFASLAQHVAPVGEGELQHSIVTRPGDSDTGIAVQVISETDHSTFVEFGTVDTPAQPFFFPLYRQRIKKSARNRIARATTKAIKKYWST